MTLQPCPNEECTCRENPVNTARMRRSKDSSTWQVDCSWCEMRGPNCATEARAESTWNALPRTEPWVSVAERMPLGCDLECYVAFSDGTVVGTLSWHGHDWRWSQDLGPFDVEDNKTATHWKPHTPPRGPVAK